MKTLNPITGEVFDNTVTPEEYALTLEEHYVLTINVFRTPYFPSIAVWRYKDFHEALNTYLLVFLNCDFVKYRSLTKHVPHVPKCFYVTRFFRRR